ncbi:hypothetical protein C3411_03105 [Citrobacter freundii complex sp. CFNIH5]|uniref:hypothetical protein n=1 Tax=Citrobacter freundii complex sp. CFNIH5 TaxID=2080671 RepID=UPI000CDD6A48|nr:hypothetical protein [Citrobacter freundii complex sp. CFNIH5]POV72434.1 hypothetical protein C3411_03105 [Citrobacter freundii complex sp. CFNIH5]
MMYHIPGILSAQDVAWFREQFDAADRFDGRATTGPPCARLKNKQQVTTPTVRYSVLQQAVSNGENDCSLCLDAS